MITQSEIDRYRNDAIAEQGLLIGGKTAGANDGQTLEVTSPIDGNVLTTIANAGTEDVDMAVKSARETFGSGIWRDSSPATKKKILHKFADLIEKNAAKLSVLGVRDNGTEMNMAYKAEAISAASTFRYYAEALDKVYGEVVPTPDGTLGLVHREPVGVVAAIIPWNFPLMIGAWKIAPALAAGNSVVLKPSEAASLSTLELGRIALEAGIPEGVLNIVTGRGSVVGKALGLHMDVDVLAFTGGGKVGRALHQYSAQSNLKTLYLELGGKSPHIVFDDVEDVDLVAGTAVKGMFRNSGQVCISGTRLLLQENIAEAVMERLIDKTRHLVVGNPLDLTTDVGAIATEKQLESNLGFVDAAREEGATLCMGGDRLHEESGGYYMSPTIFTDVTAGMMLAQEEVFGPILSVLTFKTEAEAVAQANSTKYGLASGVWTSNLGRAHRMVKQIKAGLVHVNCYGGSDLTVPLGGVKQSGNGKDKSLHALDKYTNMKSAWITY